MGFWEGCQQCSPPVSLRRAQFFCGGELSFISVVFLLCFLG